MFKRALRQSFKGAWRVNLGSTRSLVTAVNQKQHSLPAAYYRGGTSRAVFFKQEDLPADRRQWDTIFRGVIGSPDAAYGRQLDGLGGGISSLSKVCVVGGSTHPDADVDYTFVSLGVFTSDVDYSSNCGNIVSAVGPFAIDSGLFNPVIHSNPGSESGEHVQVTSVRIHNTNTGKLIRATFPVVTDGKEVEAATSGDFAIDGVVGTAAPIQLDFIRPAGSRTGKLLPTGNVVDEFDNGIIASCIDVANPCVFVRASDLGIRGDISPDEINAHPNLLARLDSIRRQAGVKMGLADSEAAVPGSIPKVCMVSSPAVDTRDKDDQQQKTQDNVDIVARAISVGQPHKAMPITVSLALAAATNVPGTTAAAALAAATTNKKLVDSAGVTIGHASGKLLVGATFGADGELEYATVFRTARRLFEGRVFWKGDTD
ncbi:hypothetical protein VTN49DRAFT_1631 [Thermomyces lanuginosus]|uniref:uncharacterized protein n=1 Tax=Thermomyces lanuginosus TaxID=5541 RepID=UPI00374206B6